MPAELLYLEAELLYLGAELLYLGPKEVLNLGVVLENLLAGAGACAGGLGLKLLPGGLAEYDAQLLKGFGLVFV